MLHPSPPPHNPRLSSGNFDIWMGEIVFIPE